MVSKKDYGIESTLVGHDAQDAGLAARQGDMVLGQHHVVGLHGPKVFALVIFADITPVA